MSQLTSLASLIELAKREDKIGTITLCFGFEKLNPDRSRDYVSEWQVSFIYPKGEYFVGEGIDAESACASLVELCRTRSFTVPTISVEEVIPNSKQVEALIFQLQTMLPNIRNGFLFLFFEYWPPLEDMPVLEWRAGVEEGSHWQSWSIAKVEGHSLYEVCTKLWEQLQSIRKPLID